MIADLQFLGALLSLFGGATLFWRGEHQRSKQGQLVSVEACEGRLCVRCGRAATVCRFDGRRWVYGASEACLYDHCQPIGAAFTAAMTACDAIRAGDVELVPLSRELDEALGLRLIREWAAPRLVPNDPCRRLKNLYVACSGRKRKL